MVAIVFFMQHDIRKLFNEFIYEQEYIRHSRPETIRGYHQVFNMFSRLTPESDPEVISPQSISRFFKLLHERKRVVGKGVIKVGIRPSTVILYHSRLMCFFEWMHRYTYISMNPFRTVKVRREQNTDIAFLSKHHIEKIIAAAYLHYETDTCIQTRNVLIIYLLLFCGLRKGELLGLQVRDIDIHKKVLTVRAEHSKSCRMRMIPLHSTILIHLKRYMQLRMRYTTPSLLVTMRGDHGLGMNGFNNLIKSLGAQSGVRFHAHQFRHTFAVNFLKTNNNVVKLKQLMGHTNICMTLVYLRCLPVHELRGDIENMRIDDFV